MDVRKSRQVLLCWLGAGALAVGVMAVGVSPAAAKRPATCSGTFESPGLLVGTYTSNVTVEGVCLVNAGPVLVEGNLTLAPGAALAAAFALDDHTGSGSSSLTVRGNLHVQTGATLFLGCNAHFACLDDPNPANPTLSSPGAVSGNLSEQQPLGVIVHDSTIGGNVQEVGGGGGLTCAPSGIFTKLGSPVYSDYEDSSIQGNLDVIGLTSCWLGVARVQVGGNLHMIDDQLADPDAIEILASQIGGNLLCQQNSRVWDSAEENFESLFPRIPQPNTVSGRRTGQCVLASPATEGGPSGPGPF
jgi:hypothetical protein